MTEVFIVWRRGDPGISGRMPLAVAERLSEGDFAADVHDLVTGRYLGLVRDGETTWTSDPVLVSDDKLENT